MQRSPHRPAVRCRGGLAPHPPRSAQPQPNRPADLCKQMVTFRATELCGSLCQLRVAMIDGCTLKFVSEMRVKTMTKDVFFTSTFHLRLAGGMSDVAIGAESPYTPSPMSGHREAWPLDTQDGVPKGVPKGVK